ncbi:MAG: Zn-ribbon domain-containing OB-fold protein [Candidatus Methylomirabilia bacterium]
MSDYKKPLPDITPESKPFWDGCRRHQFLIQWCRDCRSFQHYPRGVCATCWSDNLEWRQSSGRGKVYTFTVTYRTQARGFKEDLPYIPAYVELEEGVQVLTNLVGCAPTDVRIGMPVVVTFEDVNDEVSMPRFAPA